MGTPAPHSFSLAGTVSFDPDGTKPLPAGSFVVHDGGKVHYDGAKNEECEVIISGMGPGTSTRVGEN
jgi:hypothetical protein